MTKRHWFLLIRWISILLLMSAGGLFYVQWMRFNRAPAVLPAHSRSAGIPVGGLSLDEARQRIQQAYQAPIEVQIDQSRFNLDPVQAGFQLHFEQMLPESLVAAPTQRWQAFRDYLWGQPVAPLETELDWSYDPDRLRAYLESEIAPRYSRAPRAPRPLPGGLEFQPGQAGTELDIEDAIQQIAGVLPVLSERQVKIITHRIEPAGPAWENLTILLKQVLLISGSQALADLYVYDLKNNRELHFGFLKGQEISTRPDMVFTASSIIKIPIVVSIFRHLQTAPDANLDRLLNDMFTYSSNEAADALMKTVLSETRGPLMVTEDLQKLGLENTFLAGYFALGSPLLQQYHTPGNQRLDLGTQPDPYNQATPQDIGRLLAMIYQCAQAGTGRLVETFPGEITQGKCQQILTYLKKDRQPYLIITGLPAGTPLAHKHGYGSAHDVITTIGDAGIIFSPGGDYVLAAFFYDTELLFDPINALIGNLSSAVYRYFNPPAPLEP